jgi:hypothetical protein
MDLKKYSHLWWLAGGVVALVVIFAFTNLIGYLLTHLIAWTILGGILYALDFNFTKWLSSQSYHFGAAIVLAIVGALLTKNSLPLTLGLAVWDVVVLMCIFSVSAKFWPNANSIEERLRKDPAGVARDGFEAVRTGAKGVVTEAERLGGHFKGDSNKAA